MACRCGAEATLLSGREGGERARLRAHRLHAGGLGAAEEVASGCVACGVLWTREDRGLGPRGVLGRGAGLGRAAWSSVSAVMAEGMGALEVEGGPDGRGP